MEYADLFEEPQNLPPHRECDHTIPLMPGTEPSCNTPDVIYLICIPTLAVSGAKLFYFPRVWILKKKKKKKKKKNLGSAHV